MIDLRERLDAEETGVLQERVRLNALNDEALAVVREILAERNVLIPEPESEEALEQKSDHNLRLSWLAFVTVAAYAGVLICAQPSFRGFVLFTLALLAVLAYLRSQRVRL